MPLGAAEVFFSTPDMKTRTIAIIIALLQTIAAACQSESTLYGHAMNFARQGCKDSLFYSLDRMATLYGARDADLLPELLLEPRLRPYHSDSRWSQVKDRLRKARIEAASESPRPCQTDTATKLDNTPIVNSYDIDLTIDVAAKRIDVRADIDIDFRGNSHADLYLWR